MGQLEYVTVKQMRELENVAVAKDGITLSALMENAGRAVANEVMRLIRRGNIVIFCGYGNNGGDGMASARYLIKNGYQVKVFLVGNPKAFSKETDANHKALIDLGYKPVSISTKEEIEKRFQEMAKPEVIIDAIFGIGIHGMLSDFYLKLIDKINGIASPVISVDIPSGLEADSGESLGIAVQADKTVTFGYPKVGFKNPKAKVYLGELIIADIAEGQEKFK